MAQHNSCYIALCYNRLTANSSQDHKGTVDCKTQTNDTYNSGIWLTAKHKQTILKKVVYG